MAVVGGVEKGENRGESNGISSSTTACRCSHSGEKQGVIEEQQEEEEQGALCIICLENPRNTRLPCGHEIMCGHCAMLVMKTKSRCPTCRTRFHKVKFSSQFGKTDFVAPRASSEEWLSNRVDQYDSYNEQQRVSARHVTMAKNMADSSRITMDSTCRVMPELVIVCEKLVTFNIVSLSLTNNFIGVHEAGVLCAALSRNTTLKFLNLSSNQLGSEGATLLRDAIRFHPTLAEIHLNSNHLGPAGAQAIAKLLKENNTIEQIRLYDNALGDKGCKVIARALKTNTTLKSLNLRSNKIGLNGLSKLAKYAALNKTLETIDIGFNEATKKKIFPSRLHVLT